MKKTALFMLFALLCAVASAQSLSSSIIGSNWQAEVNVDDDEETSTTNSKMKFFLNRNSQGRLEMSASVKTVEDGMTSNMDYIVTIPYEWTSTSNTVYLEMDIESTKTVVTKYTLDGENYDSMLPMLNDAMAQPMKETMAAELGPKLHLTKVTLAPDKRSFTCYWEDDKITFYKKP